MTDLIVRYLEIGEVIPSPSEHYPHMISSLLGSTSCANDTRGFCEHYKKGYVGTDVTGEGARLRIVVQIT